MPELVLVTGAAGYLALHVVKQCLENGYKVRGTVRNLKDDRKIGPLRKLQPQANLELVEADLLDKDSWNRAINGVSVVLHVASPFPSAQPSSEDEVIRPAVEGTMNVINAAFNENVRRFVYTSSTATLIGYEHEKDFTEHDWPDMDKVTRPYIKSKILAEKAAWNFVEEKKNTNQPCFELVVLNPTHMLGPTLHEHREVFGTSEMSILRILNAEVNKVPFSNYLVCDVRDVALAHVRAITSQTAVGHRHPLPAERLVTNSRRVFEIIREEFGSKGFKLPGDVEPGKPLKATVDNSRYVKELKITPRPVRQTVMDMCNRFIELGLVRVPTARPASSSSAR